MAQPIPPPLSLYVHLPWCVRKCPYCDFNSHALRGELPETDYVAALLSDLEREAPDGGGRRIESIFLGGGTPSLFSPAAVARLLDGVRVRVAVAPEAEITLEANPGTVELERFSGFRAAGVNRLSIGIQSFTDDKLRALGRIHGRGEALRAAGAARAAGFENFNLDLMFGLPGQTLDEACADIDQALALEPTHLSAYQLTIEPNTLFHAQPPALPDDDTTWAMQEAIGARLAHAGFRHYEVSAYARAGRECRHNLNYWRFGDYLGIGAGAHGKITIGDRVLRRWKHKHPQEYLRAAGSAAAVAGEQTLSPADLAFEYMLNALRLPEGFPTSEFEARTGLAITTVEPILREAERRGWIERTPHGLRPSALGQRFLNDLLILFLPADRPAPRAALSAS